MHAALAAYLGGLFRAPVEVVALRPLGGGERADTDQKGFGYGVPFEVECAVGDGRRRLVVARTRVAQGFARSGAFVSAGDATEFFQLVEKAEGRLCWLDLERPLTEPLHELDRTHAQERGGFLARAHATKRDEPTLYERRIRELIAHGECLMGILDGYPHPYPPLPPQACEALEHGAISWRWRLRGRTHRLSCVHGRPRRAAEAR